MADFNFKKWNLILGWLAFLIAFITYSFTVEPTVSFWDAGEYILTSSKSQVGHRKYLLYQNGETQILTIHYALKKWKETLSAEFNDKGNTNYLLLICALFLMRHEQSSESSAANI